MSEGAVPVVDIAPFLGGDEGRKAAVAKAVDDACRRIGFLFVGGHGVPGAVIDDALAATWAFFDQGDAEKRRWISPKAISGAATCRWAATRSPTRSAASRRPT